MSEKLLRDELYDYLWLLQRVADSANWTGKEWTPVLLERQDLQDLAKEVLAKHAD